MDSQQLTKVDLFRQLSTESRDEIAREMKQMAIKPGTKVVKVGDVAREMFFVLSGTVSIVDTDNHEIRRLQPGTFFGELGLIHNIPRTVSVVAIDEVELGVLHKADFDKLRDRHPDIAAVINALATERFSHFQSQLTRLAPHQVQVESISSYSDEQITSFRQIFYAHSDGKAHINVEQLAKLLDKVINTGYQVSLEEAQGFMKKLDKDGDGAIDFGEFVAGLKHLSWIAGGPDAPKSSNSTLLVGAAVAGVALISAVVAISLWRKKSSK